MIFRLFVEKKPQFAIEAGALLEQVNESGRLRAVRVLNRYDVENLRPENREAAIRYVFSEPMVDQVYVGDFPIAKGERCFAVEYLPGQYNQRADSAAQCLQLVTKQTDCVVETAKVYVFDGDIDDSFLDGVKAQLINPVDSREASLETPDTLTPVWADPGPVSVIEGFTAWDDARLAGFHAGAGLAMSMADLKLIQAHFRKTEKRDLTETELRVLDTYWSDHCRHTTFLTAIRNVEIEPGEDTAPVRDAYERYLDARRALYAKERDVSLMDIATIGMKQLKAAGKLEDLDESLEINACSIRVDADMDGKTEPWLVQFKNETHNHPTEIEPFGGAATCLGGAIRDPLSGRAYVYQAVRVTGAGDPRVSGTLPGKLPQKRLTREAARGFSSYGNQIGLATGLVREIYHPGFVAKRMEIGAVVGAAPAENVRRAVPQPGDRVLLVGGRTGRDGCGGATGSSKAHTEQSLHTCGAEVQKGNPVTERKLQRLFRNPEAARLIKRCNDFGAGGVSVAVGELADGLDIDLDSVPKKYEGLGGTELAISESQERMAVVVAAGDVGRFTALCRDENLEAAEIARVTEEPRVRMRWRRTVITDLPRALLDTSGARQTADVLIQGPSADCPFLSGGGDVKRRWLSLMGELNVCGQIGLSEQFDSSIGAGTVLMPFGGEQQLTPAEVSVCKLPLTRGETNTATVMAHGYDPAISEWNPFHGAVYAVTEALAKITACGGDHTRTRFSFQEYFEKLGRDPVKWGKALSGVLGAYWATTRSGCAAIGGKDSMSGTFRDISVPPVVAAFGLCVCDARHVISPEFKKPGHKVVLVPAVYDRHRLPDFDALRENYAAVHSLILKGVVRAAHTVGRFGAAEALAKMCFGNRLGVRLDKDGAEDLFNSANGALILEMTDVSAIPGAWRVMGEVWEQSQILAGEVTVDVSELLEAWMATLEPVFPTKPRVDVPVQEERAPAAAEKVFNVSLTHTKPVVLIPVFPGTNCEYDSQRAFERAGASVETMIFRNLTPTDVGESIAALNSALGRAHILMLAGGFSAGDEPDGSAKFITAVCRNPSVTDAIHGLLERGGLILGICNGFQALIKLGLLTHGKIVDPDANAPTLSYNTVGRHISHIAVTRIVSNRSPWLMGVKPKDLHSVPVSHGEGRFVAPRATVQALFENGQVASVYHGNNLNGSDGEIEGIISSCGRILGKMGHSERLGRHTCKNIPGVFDQRIFESGTAYFTT